MRKNISKDCSIAIDYGGTKMLIGIVDRQGNILNYKRYSTGFRDQESSKQKILLGLDDYLKSTTNENHHIRGIGIGIVGYVDPKTGYWHVMYDEGDHGVALAEIIEKIYNIPCSIDNDVKAATIAEMEFGIGKNTDDFIYLNIGTGIAAGFVCNKRLVRGVSNDAGEIGHIFVEGYSKVRCWCGLYGCFEALSSGYGIVVRYTSSTKDSFSKISNESKNAITVTNIFKQAKEGDILSKRIAVDAADAISKMIVNLSKIFNTGTIVLNGGVVTNQWFYKAIKDNLIYRNKSNSEIKIILSKFNPSMIGLIGAAMLGFRTLPY